MDLLERKVDVLELKMDTILSSVASIKAMFTDHINQIRARSETLEVTESAETGAEAEKFEIYRAKSVEDITFLDENLGNEEYKEKILKFMSRFYGTTTEPGFRETMALDLPDRFFRRTALLEYSWSGQTRAQNQTTIRVKMKNRRRDVSKP